MEKQPERPRVLRLPGITLKDYTPIEDVFDGRILEDADAEAQPPEPLPFDQIPRVFTRLEDWPMSSNLRCWSCAFSFDGAPWFIPTYVRAGSEGPDSIEIGVLGNFCTANCAARHIDVVYPAQAFAARHAQMRDNLCLVYYIFTKRRIHHVPAAPDKTERLEFGGVLSEEDFWEELRELDPKHGLRDHRPGTVVPERLRPPGVTVWEICGAAANEAAANEAGTSEAAATEAGASEAADTEAGACKTDDIAPAGAVKRPPLACNAGRSRPDNLAEVGDARGDADAPADGEDAPADGEDVAAPAPAGDPDASGDVDFDQMLNELYDL